MPCVAVKPTVAPDNVFVKLIALLPEAFVPVMATVPNVLLADVLIAPPLTVRFCPLLKAPIVSALAPLSRVTELPAALPVLVNVPTLVPATVKLAVPVALPNPTCKVPPVTAPVALKLPVGAVNESVLALPALAEETVIVPVELSVTDVVPVELTAIV